MRILSIHDGHNSSAALFDDDKILSCISEERINREKFYLGWPELSIRQVLNENKLNLKDIDIITVSHLNTFDYAKRKILSKANYSLNLKMMLGHFYNIFIAFKREMKVRNLVRGQGKKEIFFCDHHLAHAASAYYYSGFDDALVVTMDGLGDSLSHTAYLFKRGEQQKILQGESNASMGTFYMAITSALGFKPNRHEGKIVGLAAMGNGKNIDDGGYKFVEISDDYLHFKRKPYYEMIAKVKEWLAAGFKKEDVAAYAQDLLEDLVIKHCTKLCQITSSKNLALAGGVFANVKLNQKLTENCPIEKIFIQPGMGDEGLVLGSAAYYLDKFLDIKISKILENVYLCTAYDDKYIEKILRAQGYKFEIMESTAKKVAGLIYNGKIIGWFDGSMEFGPRALGHRTIMADPRKKEINEILNKRLKRSEFMPFAPSVLYENAVDVFKNTSSGMHTAEFMTITFLVKEEWCDKIKAVVHVDNTARPQFVKKEINKNFYNCIAEYYKLSGIPLIINTSFNMHEEPIVCSPEDALLAFKQGAVDYLVFNNRFLVFKNI